MSQMEEEKRAADGDELNKSQSYGQIVWRQFRKNRPALASLWCIALLAFVALTADLIAGNKPYYMEYKGKTYSTDLDLEHFCHQELYNWLDAKELKKEKAVVIDEINSYKENPSEQIFDDFDSGLILDDPQFIIRVC